MENLNKYFDLFDQSRTSDKAMEQLNGLFTDDMVFVLNGQKKEGIENWKLFMEQVFRNNRDIKHMYEGWEKVEGSDLYETPWAVCGKLSSGKVYTQTGKDIAKLNENGQITYLENVPDQKDMFQSYKEL
ncbi:nuclear transport factor 2 family protein [Guptibacillus hwajinpoensis]|uniref:nuclear transport factor 2 family protein n=1 Tax=Guptibacillus hwajinpoensis TaxID=208199 RepID=UPI001CFF3E35|nr:nuclear transport factor 2 family protein [Pseudalkalibacillus hwajinpoensis]WLR58979.1 nuclear transport factor 2 family protein [Pseudalkalibacillus hwajinpoensis]